MNMFYATGLPGWSRLAGEEDVQKEPDATALEERATDLEEELRRIRQKIEELKKG